MSTEESAPPGSSFAPTPPPSIRLVLALIAVVSAIVGGVVAFGLFRGDGPEPGAIAAGGDRTGGQSAAGRRSEERQPTPQTETDEPGPGHYAEGDAATSMPVLGAC